MNLDRTHLEVAFLRIPLIGGTNGNFAELNRQPPDISVMDGVAYTINPQVHAFDERSLIEAIEAERDTVVAARSFCGALPITVSSVTLKPPFNQAAIEPGSDWDPHELPSSVDPRQMSLFAAAWTVGSLASLGIGGADSITYYETTGWRGLIETEAGNPLPEKFPSYSAMVYPVYWIFAFLSEAKQAEFLRIESANPLLVGGLGLKKGNRRWILVSNYQPFDQLVHISSLPKGSGVLRRLNQVSMKKAAAAPETYRAQGKSLDLKDPTLEITLRPYETICVDYQVQV
jgi:hypothetical protein